MSNQHIVCARAARQEFADAFEGGIGDFREVRFLSAMLSRSLSSLPNLAIKHILRWLIPPDVADMAFEGTVETTNKVPDSNKNFLVMARPRPLDCCPCVTTEVHNNAVVSHDGRVHRDGRTLYLIHSRFHLDKVFASDQGNSNIFETACLPLVKHAQEGQRATLLFFGQTGTGKTYTTFGVQEELGRFLEDQKEAFTLQIYELAGDGGKEQGFDLLSQRTKVKLLEGEDGYVHVRGAKVVTCSSKTELDAALAEAKVYRCSEATERNEASSRSHAVFEINLASGGLLRLVDLAGSERNSETVQHTKQMATRGGHINASLQNLKECGRIMYRKTHGHDHLHVPFRSSKLTHLLRDCFTDTAHKTAVVGTLSPLADDVEHTLNTLQHLITLRGGSDREKRKERSASIDSKDGEDFHKIDGRGKRLHSKLQDNDQLDLHVFRMVGPVGGSIHKKYDAENVKMEPFIDPRWHPELNARVEEDLWVYQEADKEVLHPLKEWQEQQYREKQVHSVSTWSCYKVQEFMFQLFIDREFKPTLPRQMDGKMLGRLGETRLKSILGEEDGAVLQEALMSENQRHSNLQRTQADRNAKLNGLSKNQIAWTMVKRNKENDIEEEEVADKENAPEEATVAESTEPSEPAEPSVTPVTENIEIAT